MARPVLLMDVDGVVADFTGHLLKHIDAPFDATALRQWQFIETLDKRLQRKTELVLKKSSFWETIAPIPGALAGIEKLKEQTNGQVVWITAPWRSCRNWEAIRRDWLAHHFGAEARDVLTVERKELIVGDVFVDDRVENVQMVTAAGHVPHVFLFDAPYNREFKFELRVDWSNLVETVVQTFKYGA